MSARLSVVFCAVLATGDAFLATGDALGSPASDAYDKATLAFQERRFDDAALGFATADKLEPNPVALESGLKASIAADDPAIGMELVTRAESRPPSPRVVPLAKQARETFEKRAGKLAVTCPAEPRCVVRVDGEKREPGIVFWVRAGTKIVEVVLPDAKVSHQVDVMPGAQVDFAVPEREKPKPKPQPAPPPAETPPPRRLVEEPAGGAHPGFAIATGGLFLAAAGVTIWSGIDTLQIHSDFVHAEATAEEGKSAQLRTNIMLGVTGGGAVAFTIVAVLTDWKAFSRKKSSPVGENPAASLRLGPTRDGIFVNF
jgi:hypothetical protein